MYDWGFTNRIGTSPMEPALTPYQSGYRSNRLSTNKGTLTKANRMDLFTNSYQRLGLDCIQRNPLSSRDMINHLIPDLKKNRKLEKKTSFLEVSSEQDEKGTLLTKWVEGKLTLCRVPWYLLPGFPRPAMSHGVYSGLAPSESSGSEARARERLEESRRRKRRRRVGLKGIWMEWGRRKEEEKKAVVGGGERVADDMWLRVAAAPPQFSFSFGCRTTMTNRNDSKL